MARHDDAAAIERVLRIPGGECVTFLRAQKARKHGVTVLIQTRFNGAPVDGRDPLRDG